MNKIICLVDGEHYLPVTKSAVLNINDSNVIHYGSDTTNEIGANTIVSAKNRATLNGYRIMLTLKGINTDYFENPNSINLE